jgi:hypothetical protein
MATARAFPRASEHVQRVVGGVVMARARGESEGRTRLTGRGRALARPVTCQGALTACLAGFLACLGTRVPANGVQGSSQGWYQQVQ